ncbi:MAG TPA: T9SS type A sorting domain-containing protein [Pricia sp.]|nr:T9SS type A sorting domain-containing protein [Pricia sp.]
MTGLANEPEPSLETNKLTNDLVFNLDSRSERSIVKLSDVQGNVLFQENILNGSYTRTFDIENFKKGTYFLVVNSSNKTVFTIRLIGDKVEIFKSWGNSKPIFKKVGGMVYLNLMNLHRNDVAIKVTDSRNRVVFKETVKNTGMVQRAYNFEKAFENSYTIVVKDGKDTYYENIVVR